MEKKYIEKSWEHLNSILAYDYILLLTATDIETAALHKTFKPLEGLPSIIKTHKDSQTYYLAMFGKYRVAHVQSGMGSMSREGSILTTQAAITDIKPKFVLMVGIAFGVDDTKQKVGDVLVSEAILPYNFKRIGQKKTIIRQIPLQSSNQIANRFKNLRTWEFILDNGQKSELICGHLLSGEELIDNKKYRDRLLDQFPTAKGGEMEGAGVHAACDGKAQCIIVKGICDFADGNKHQNKDHNQKVAVNAAISACLELFSSETAFSDFYTNAQLDKISAKVEVAAMSPDTNKVLFDLYSKESDPFYIVREYDNDFFQTLKQYGVWISGPTGCGKSNLILRNLLVHNKNFFTICLANCIGQNIDFLFFEILLELESQIGDEQCQIQPKHFKDTQRSIISLFQRSIESAETIIFIEEIPIESELEYKEFTEKIIAIVIDLHYKIPTCRIKFVLSTISNPDKYLHSFQQKALQQIKFINLTYWNTQEITQLVVLICTALKIDLEENFAKKLVSTSKGSPRLIKKFFRNIIALGRLNAGNLNTILEETKKELNIA